MWGVVWALTTAISNTLPLRTVPAVRSWSLGSEVT